MKTKLEAIAELKLLPYQSAFAANKSRFKIGLWARQTGKDHTATAEAVADCYQHPGTTWIIVAASERQALESLAKAKEWACALKLQIEDYTEAAANVPYSVARTASTEIRWSNGSRLMALPANPSTIRGYSANLILTEFAFHENPDAIWRAIYPAISNPLRGGVKKLRIISTPNGLNNKFAQIWKANTETDAPIFHAKKITIHDAIQSGLPLDANELQAGLNDPEAWAQEYLCEFMDNSTVLLPYDLIETCESSLASEVADVQSLSASAIPGGHRPELFAGIDFARKNHMTVLWVLEKLPASAKAFASPAGNAPVFLTREVLCLRNMSTPEQMEVIRPRIQHCRKICLDYTGPGVGLGDFLHREMGARVELCPFTAPFKAELFPRLAAAMEARQLLIPIGRDIREDLHSIYRTTTNSGTILYRAHATPDGHADRTTALALALRAGQSAPVCVAPSSVGRRNEYLASRNRNRYSAPQRTIAVIY